MSNVKEILSNERVNRIVKAIQGLIVFLKDEAYSNPTRNFQPITNNITRKKMVFIDNAAEKLLAERLNEIFRDSYEVSVYGEESLGLPVENKTGDIGRFLKKSAQKEKLVFLLDAVDGTDLYLKNLGNWCTAVLMYTDKQKKILGSFVGLPNGTVYFSTADINGVAKKPTKKNIAAVSMSTPATKSDLKNITLSWYGQKAHKFLSMARHKRFSAFLRSQSINSNFRMLNIGGIPLMIRMIDNMIPIDVMVELHGQQPHDMIAGAWLAQKAGAILTNLKGGEIDFSCYLDNLKGERLKYILTTSKKCHKKALKIFGK